MDGKGFEDSGLSERSPYGSEPDENQDPLPRRRPGIGYVFRAVDDEPLALPSRPHDPDPPTSGYQAWVSETDYDPSRFPAEPYGGTPRAGRPYVPGARPPSDP